MNQKNRTNALIAAHESDPRFDQVFHYTHHARELASAIDHMIACAEHWTGDRDELAAALRTIAEGN